MGGLCCGDVPEGLLRGVWGCTEAFGGAPEESGAACLLLGLGFICLPPLDDFCPPVLVRASQGSGWCSRGGVVTPLRVAPLGVSLGQGGFWLEVATTFARQESRGDARPVGCGTPKPRLGAWGPPNPLGRCPSLPPPPCANVGHLNPRLQRPPSRSRPWSTTGCSPPRAPNCSPQGWGGLIL